MPPNKILAQVLAKSKTNRSPSLERKPTGNALTFFKSALATQVKTDDLSRDDVIIVVMGPTGSGKSSFINAITGLETGVGNDLESCTSIVSNVRLSIPEISFGDLVFVDTPGFDDTRKKDVDILKMVADWLKSTYEKNILLSGLLYFHRISDNRMAGTPLKNLRMFEKLCGKNAFHNVILTTTMWDEVDEETGMSREKELETKYWRTMLERGSTISRFRRTRESAFDIIEPLIDEANRQSSVLLQSELVDMSKSLPATAAGLELFSAMGQLVSQREDLLRRIRHEMRSSNGDKMALEPLKEEHQRLQESLEATVNEMRRLRLPFGRRFWIATEKFLSTNLKFEPLMSFISKMKQGAAPNTASLIGSSSHVYRGSDHDPTGANFKDPFDHTSADRDHVSTGVVSKDSIDYTPQVLGSMTSHGAAPNTESSTSSITAVFYADRGHVPTGAISKDPIDYTPADRDHVSTGVISKDPVDYTPQVLESMMSHGVAPNTESLTSSIAAVSSGYAVPTGAISEDPVFYSPADRDNVSTGAIYKDPIDCTPQSPGSMKRHGAAAPNIESLTSSNAALSHADRYHFPRAFS